jgi:LacI family transcriptional regulator
MDTIFKDINIPSVFLDSYVEDHDLDMIVIDDEEGGFLATEHLIQSGKTKIGLVVSMLDEVGVASKRHDGYKRALNQYNIEYQQERIFEGYTTNDFGTEIGKKISENIENFDALFVYSDIMAMSVIRALKENGIKVPDDIAVVGFDGLFIGELSEPTLTTINQDITKKGELAVDLLMKKINKESTETEKVIMPVNLVKRKST